MVVKAKYIFSNQYSYRPFIPSEKHAFEHKAVGQLPQILRSVLSPSPALKPRLSDGGCFLRVERCVRVVPFRERPEATSNMEIARRKQGSGAKPRQASARRSGDGEGGCNSRIESRGFETIGGLAGCSVAPSAPPLEPIRFEHKTWTLHNCNSPGHSAVILLLLVVVHRSTVSLLLTQTLHYGWYVSIRMCQAAYGELSEFF